MFYGVYEGVFFISPPEIQLKPQRPFEILTYGDVETAFSDFADTKADGKTIQLGLGMGNKAVVGSLRLLIPDLSAEEKEYQAAAFRAGYERFESSFLPDKEKARPEPNPDNQSAGGKAAAFPLNQPEQNGWPDKNDWVEKIILIRQTPAWGEDELWSVEESEAGGWCFQIGRMKKPTVQQLGVDVVTLMIKHHADKVLVIRKALELAENHENRPEAEIKYMCGNVFGFLGLSFSHHISVIEMRERLDHHLQVVLGELPG
jgi:hypothetical protein